MFRDTLFPTLYKSGCVRVGRLPREALYRKLSPWLRSQNKHYFPSEKNLIQTSALWFLAVYKKPTQSMVRASERMLFIQRNWNLDSGFWELTQANTTIDPEASDLLLFGHRNLIHTSQLWFLAVRVCLARYASCLVNHNRNCVITPIYRIEQKRRCTKYRCSNPTNKTGFPK